MSRPRVLLADDHRVVAEGLKQLLTEDFEVLEIVEDGRALVLEAERLRPDVIVADISMPRLNGIDALLSISQLPGGVPATTVGLHSKAPMNAAMAAHRIMKLADA